MSVLNNDCNVIKFQRTIPSVYKYHHNILPLNHLHEYVILRTNLYIKTFEDKGKINYYLSLSIAIIRFSFTLLSLDQFLTPKCS